MTTEPLSTDELADHYADQAQALIAEDPTALSIQRAIVLALLALEARLDHIGNVLEINA